MSIDISNKINTKENKMKSIKCMFGFHDDKVLVEAWGNINIQQETFGIPTWQGKMEGLTRLLKCKRCGRIHSKVILAIGNECEMNTDLVIYKMREAGLLKNIDGILN